MVPELRSIEGGGGERWRAAESRRARRYAERGQGGMRVGEKEAGKRVGKSAGKRAGKRAGGGGWGKASKINGFHHGGLYAGTLAVPECGALRTLLPGLTACLPAADNLAAIISPLALCRLTAEADSLSARG